METIWLTEQPDLMDKVVDTITNSSYFKSVAPELLKEVMKASSLNNLKTGEVLIKQGAENDSMVYILIEGYFEVYRDDNFILKIHHTGQIIGEMAAISSDPRSADVRAGSEAQVVGIASDFLNRSNPEDLKLANSFMGMFTRVLAEKLRITTERAKLYEDAVLETKEIEEYSQELKKDIQQKLEQIKLYSQVVESNQDAIFVCDIEGRIQLYNQAANRLFQLEGHQVEGESIKSRFDHLLDDGSEFFVYFKDGWQGERRAFSFDDNHFPAFISISPIESDKGKDILAFAVEVRDIAIQKEYEENILEKNRELQQTYHELESTVNELEKSNQVKDDFLSNMSSQLKTPLVRINNYVELLDRLLSLNDDQPSGRRYLEDISNEEKKLHQMVGNLLTLAEINTGMSDLKLHSHKIKNLFKILDQEFPEAVKQVKLRSMEDEHFIVIDIDKVVKAMGETLEYAIRNKKDDTVIHLDFVENNQAKSMDFIFDLGITYEHERSEELFDDLSNGIELAIQKGDLNLPIAKRIVELHHGELTIRHDQGREWVKISLPMTVDKGIQKSFKIMIVDDSEADRMLLRGVSERIVQNVEVYEFNDQMSAINAMNALSPDLIIVDPDFEDAFWNFDIFMKKITKEVKETASVLALSNLWNDITYRNSFLELGITDFLPKPFIIADAEFKIRTLVQISQRFTLLSRNVERAEKSAVTDGMTGLFNRKYYDKFIEEQLMKARIQSGKCSVIMGDVDNFKHYNDTNGHQLGDEVLKKVANILRESVRESDMVARYGGEEFVVVLPGTAKKMALIVAEKIRAAIANDEFPNQESQPLGNLTSSFGVATYPENGSTPEILLKGADHCLYLAKKKGRNAVVGAEGIVEIGDE